MLYENGVRVSVPMSGRVFANTIREVADKMSDLDHRYGYSQKLENLARDLDMSDTMGFVVHTQFGLYVAFSKDNGKTEQFTKDTTIGTPDEMAKEISDWCITKGIFK